MRGGGRSADTMSLSIDGAPTDLETGFQLAHLLLTDATIEPAAVERWKQGQKQFLQMRSNVPQMAFMETMMQTAYPKDEPRTQMLGAANIDALTRDAAQAYLKQTLASAPMEVAIVGDIPRERAMELVSKYLGSLPKRDRIASTTLDAKRTLKRPVGPIVMNKDLPTKTKQALVSCGFYGADTDNIADTRALQMAARTISSRMVKVIREQEQLVYSISASSRPGTDWPGFGMFSAMAPTDPAKVNVLSDKIKVMYDEFAASGPTEEEMSTAKLQVANELDDTMRQPGFWAGRLADLDYRGRNLDDVMAAPSDFQNMTTQQVKAAFNKYYKPESFLTISLTPVDMPNDPTNANEAGKGK